MEGENRKKELMEACMQIVAEEGLNGFVMKKVTKRIGVSEALIYRYFETKEKLFQVCFELVDRQIAALFNGYKAEIPETPEGIYKMVRYLWMTYITFLVKNDYRTLYYFAYRDSNYMRDMLNNTSMAQQIYFKSFIDICELYREKFHMDERTSLVHFWIYILDTAGIFAKRIIHGDLPDTPESYESTWQLISGGIWGVLGDYEGIRRTIEAAGAVAGRGEEAGIEIH